jgi:hypothetical protein
MSNFISDEEFKSDSNFIPDDKFVSDQDKYGSLGQSAIAGLEGAARGATLGASDFVASKISSPEAVRARELANPVSSNLGNMAGGAALIYGTGGLAAPAEAALSATGVGATAARALAYGAEGAAFGGANTISDIALGDTDITASKVLADLTVGAAIGGGLGLLSKGLEALPMLKSKAKIEVPEALPAPEELQIENPPPPESLKEMMDFNDKSEFMGQGFENPPPKVSELEAAVERLPDLQSKPTGIHKEQLLGKTEWDRVNALLKKTPEYEDSFNKYSRGMRHEIDSKTSRTIDTIADGYKPTSDAVEGGDRAIEMFSKNYQAEQKEAGQLLNKIKNLDIGTGDHLPPLIDRIAAEFPDVAKIFDTTTDQIKVNPYSTKYGIDESTYNAMKTIVKDLDNGAKDIKELFAVRKGLDQFVDFTKGGTALNDVSRLKAIMMDYAQSLINESGLDLEARDAFKRYAINEQQRQVVEKVFGASVGSKEFGAISKIKPELINGKIFQNTATVEAARKILPQEDFNKLLANYVSQLKDSVTNDGVLSSAKFGTILNNKKLYALENAFQGKDAVLQRIKDLNTVARLVPDLPPGNPGTANTLAEIMRSQEKYTLDLAGVGKFIKKATIDKIDESLARTELNDVMAGRAHTAEKLNIIKKIADKTTKKIEEGAKSIFTGAGRGSVISGFSGVTSDEYSERVKKVQKLANEPAALMDHLGNSTAAMQAAAPNVTQSINNTVTNAISYLNSKIPTTNSHFVLSKPPKPSPAQMYKFNKYFQIVSEPLSVLDQVKSGSLTSESMEALQAVHPKLLVEMQKSILGNWDQEEAEKLPYSVKMSLSKFSRTAA